MTGGARQFGRVVAVLLLAAVLGCRSGENRIVGPDDAGPDFSGTGLVTSLHSDGGLFASLTAERFVGHETSGQKLYGVRVHFAPMTLTVTSTEAELRRAEIVLRGSVEGELQDGRHFATERLVYDRLEHTVRLAGPAVFSGRGHRFRAEGGALADDRFESIELRGPIEGAAQSVPEERR
jgi:hypothetical protein